MGDNRASAGDGFWALFKISEMERIRFVLLSLAVKILVMKKIRIHRADVSAIASLRILIMTHSVGPPSNGRVLRDARYGVVLGQGRHQ